MTQNGGVHMLILIIGLLLFLGVHSFTMFRGARAAAIGRFGALNYKFAYTAKSLIGLGLIIYGFHRYRLAGLEMVWYPPEFLRPVTFVLMWLAFISLAAMGKRPGKILGLLRHPMLAAVKFWALAHLLANGDLGGMLLFGGFLAWAVADRIAVKKRGDLGAARQPHFTRADAMVLAVGTVAYIVMVLLHPYLIGVSVGG